MKCIFPYKNLDLYHTLISGQTFEWELDKESDIWSGFIYGNPIKIKQMGDFRSGNLEYEADKNLDEEINKYFGFEEDYINLIDRISFDPSIKVTLDKLNGLRVIRQDPWYCINSFILSSNNTVKNIRNILINISVRAENLQPLRKSSLQETDIQNKFPTFEKIKHLTEQDLRNCKAGFRARYLRDFYDRVEKDPNFIDSIKSQTYDEGKQTLMSIKGIGEKVADCILLYAYGKYEAYPIDTHLRKATLECYFSDDTKYPKKPSDKELRVWAKAYWGELGGFAHFFLFTYRRLYGRIG